MPTYTGSAVPINQLCQALVS